MNNTYHDLVNQTFYFPQEGFGLEGNTLLFHGIKLYDLLEKYGTPLKLVYLPKISDQIRKAKNYFDTAIFQLHYKGKYNYTYCTKSSHFRYVLEEVLKNDVHLETSSAFDIDLIWKLHSEGLVPKDKIIVNNGFKNDSYIRRICGMIQSDFTNIIPVMDNRDELEVFQKYLGNQVFDIGLRVATEEEPHFEFYTSRLGIRKSEIIEYYKEHVQPNENVRLKMLHFFVDTGIKDNVYYWDELRKGIKTYCELKKLCPTLEAINIGGGLPIKNSLGFEYDYGYMVLEIVRQIQGACAENGIPEPDIYTEFGKYTVGESGAHFFSVIGQKQQNDNEWWYMVDNSLMNTLPDAWGINERFILLPINHWDREYKRVNIGGLSCDNSDYYNSEAHSNQVYLPAIKKDEKLYLGFFHSGAYQDALSGYGGIKHCLLPSPKHVLIDKDPEGNIIDWVWANDQDSESMLKILGY